jgi:hypothetical protein
VDVLFGFCCSFLHCVSTAEQIFVAFQNISVILEAFKRSSLMRLLIMLSLEVLKLLLPCSAMLCLTSKAATATVEELGRIL